MHHASVVTNGSSPIAAPFRHGPIANRDGAKSEAVTVAVVTVDAKFARPRRRARERPDGRAANRL
jgi:hypothetical protein